MQSFFDHVTEMHNKFEIPASKAPSLLSVEDNLYRVYFMQEELREYIEATSSNNLEDAFDALIDLVIVVLGTAYLMRLPFNDGFKRVHEANLLKQRVTTAAESKRGSLLDLKKPAGWQKPNLKDLLVDTNEA